MKIKAIAATLLFMISTLTWGNQVLNPGSDRFYVDAYVGESGDPHCYTINVSPNQDYVFGYSNGTPMAITVSAATFDSSFQFVDVGSVGIQPGTPFTIGSMNSPSNSFTLCVGNGATPAVEHIFVIMIDTVAKSISLAYGESVP